MFWQAVGRPLALVILIAGLLKLNPDFSSVKNIILREQRELPAVYSFDDPADCFYTSSGALKSQEEENSEPRVYCVAKTFIDPSSPLSRAVEATRGPHRFDRNVLSSGVCIDKCEQLLSLDSRATTNDSQASTREVFHFGSDDLRQKYASKVQQCVNAGLERYQGTAQASIEFCTTDQGEPYDSLDLFFFVVLFAVLAITVASTVYDYHGGKIEVLRSSSLISNWSKFTQEPGPKDIVFLDFVKVLAQSFNVGSHVYYLAVSNPHRNSVFFELDRYTIFLRVFLGFNFTNDVFFILNGYLSTLGDAKKIDTGKVYSLRDLAVAVRNRYARLVPLLALVILVQSTWAAKFFSGPSWMYLAEREKAFCRNSYWTNLLFVNNFFNLDTSCLMPTWYLGNDFQLYILKYLFLMGLSRLSKHKVKIFAFWIASSVALVMAVAYVIELKGVFLLSMEGLRSFTRTDYHFNHFLKPTYVNICCYFCGVGTAFLDHHIRNQKVDLRKSGIFTFSWHLMKFLLIVLMCAAYITWSNSYESRLLFAVIAGLNKLAWGFVLSVFILGYRNGFGGFWRELMNARGWKRLSKLTYGALLTHVMVYQLLVGDSMTLGPIQMSFGFFGIMVVYLVALTYTVSVIFYMLVELPAANIYDCWLKSS